MTSKILTLLLFVAIPFIGQAQEDYKEKHNLKETFVNPQKHEVDPISDKTVKTGQHPKNIILMIGDGMGTAQLFAAKTANGGELYITNMPWSGFSTTNSADNYITDSAAGGTAIATGEKTYNGAIGVDVDKKPLKTILEISEEHGKATGLVSSSAITHATPASFIAHNESRHNYEAIAADFLKTDIDIFIGGGKSFFESREDGRNLLNELKAKDYQIFDSVDEASETDEAPMAILTAEKHNPAYPERGEVVPEGTEKAVKVLSENEEGFFLMVEGSQIDWGGHENNTAYIVQDALDFDRAVGRALKFAAKDGETLVIVTADHETGGMSIDNGDFEKGEITAKYTTGGHTGIMVPVFAFGPGAEEFSGVMDNTDIFKKMFELFGY
ncbi:alkaline phosphatase [Marinilabilia rubra]|uniref:Alkaline phosphatase n=1 Tax=Marinilabilia rubra TaxID=2162893 RepID=A0A2U2B9U4_9BACT|nr:alkaline phosphatase [Marinilabilia rubra]PWD99806.1 alkaline phosphatase [Marinilabilia rubra]